MEELEKYFFFSFGNSLNKTPSILEGRVVKVSHSTRTAILQLVDPVCAAVQDTLRPEFGIFIFCQFFLPNCG